MIGLALYSGDALQLALVAISVALMLFSINAYTRRSEGRYVALAVAFVCLCAASASTLVLELYAGIGPATVETVELYLIPSLEFLMVLGFLTALLWSSRFRSGLKVLVPVAILGLGLLVTGTYLSNVGSQSGSAGGLPAMCSKPSDGFLIVASSLGYNDSVGHGAPVQSWPVMDIPQGSNVTITICNTYQASIGFQIVHYLQGKVETIAPGQALTVSFLADVKGGFLIYCSIPCPIHLYLQGGELTVV
ncbi:MAG: hypothetical protein OK456_03095 [Thaumarchaeota archaeon]|nr:hypothetical protein [Nitrososphaerota archaeon]